MNSEGESGGRRHNFKASGSYTLPAQVTGQTGVRVDGDPAQPITLITTFLSPTQFLAPRVVRFNVTYKFNR